ncbi:membrane protein insertion efficiency factor YidD [Bacillus toyonensis]|uniref:membrane protein insertion efficiency factor YidD n=1 Tax=Bacillus toyonensis TaxID=155322 RepID=UPI000BEDD89C|nr:membrane protein insertion efficiency factor YidD [Bacillus toyonensis]
MLNKTAILLIKVYQRTLSKQIASKLNVHCAHYPSCSRYAIIAYHKYSFVHATRLVRSRLTNCGSSNRSYVDYP